MQAVLVAVDPVDQGEIRFGISKAALCGSKLLESMIRDDAEDEVSEIPIIENDVKVVLREVVAFLEYSLKDPLMTIPKPLSKGPSGIATLRGVVQDWYADFIEEVAKDRGKLKSMILAANYLDVPTLLKLAAARYACGIINTKSTDELKETLGTPRE